MIVAECSQNFHNFREAKHLLELARDNGADLVKFQLFDGVKLYGKKAPAELDFKQAQCLFNWGEHLGIEVFFSVFDVERVKWCEEIGVKRYKVASRMARVDVIRVVKETGKLTLYSYGGLHVFSEFLEPKKVLYCVSEYPAQVSFRGIDFRDRFQGFSDHTIGLDAAKIALARGAEIIEKHFCFRHDYGADAEWSMTPEELRGLKDWELTCQKVL